MSQKPSYIDDLMFISVLLLFLLINYDNALSNIYDHMTQAAILLYLVPIIFNLFNWPDFYAKGQALKSIGVGIGSGIAFLFLYSSLKLSTTPFATTTFGGSDTMGKMVFGGLIPTVETVFFFVLLLYWVMWKIGASNEITDIKTILSVVFIAAVFMLFHATAKGINNQPDMIATFLFGVLSGGLVVYFKDALTAIALHVTINAKSIGLVEAGSLLTTPVLVGAAAILFILNRKGVFHLNI